MAIAVAGILLGRAGPAQSPTTPLVAVLEHPQCKKPSQIMVRPLFTKDHDEWMALGSREILDRAVPGERQWTITLDGRNRGILRTTAARPDTPGDRFTRDMLLELAPGQQPLHIANIKKQFGGWCEPPPDRPLVLVNGDNFRDPDAWKPFTPSAGVRQIVFPAFHRAVDSVYNCPKDPEKAVLFDYTWSDLKIVAGYRDRVGRTIVAVELDPRAWTCDALRDPIWDMHWFRFVDQPVLFGRSLELVDAGDYDADGKSELLFWHSGYDEDGYTLFSPDFTKRVDYWWSYH